MSGYVDLEMDDEDKLDAAMPMAMDRPDYPCGLRICLTHVEMKKLGIEADCDVGDYLMASIMMRVTSRSTNSGEGGDTCRVELQIEKMKIIDDGDDGGEGES